MMDSQHQMIQKQHARSKGGQESRDSTRSGAVDQTPDRQLIHRLRKGEVYGTATQTSARQRKVTIANPRSDLSLPKGCEVNHQRLGSLRRADLACGHGCAPP